MRGIGPIFEAYRDGVLEDDDEVAVVHGPQETGYRAGSDAMVNIRATLKKALHVGVLDGPTRSERSESGDPARCRDPERVATARGASRTTVAVAGGRA